MFNRRLTHWMFGLVLALAAAATWAQTYPNRAVRLVVSYPPGGASDLMARVLGEKLGQHWKQTVVIENRPGAGGSLGTDYAARQPADGYSFLVGNMGPSLINPLLTKVPYNMGKDFTPVSLIATAPVILVVNGNSPHKTLQDVVNAEKAKPASLNFGSGGAGSLAHLVGEMLNHAANIQMQHVPYKGGIAAVNDVLAGQLDMVAADPQAVVQHVKSGKLRALAVSGAQRTATLPGVPTFAESGMSELVALNSWGVYLPAATPKPVVDAFQDGLSKAMKDPDLVKRFTELGVETLNSSAEELRAFNAAEVAKYARIIKDKNIRAD
jgi:tripartite-type tricarboxylate transporter receptor subunit TctC